MSEEAKPIINAYELALKTEEREWTQKFHNYELKLSKAEGFFQKKKYNQIMAELKTEEKIHNKYCEGLNVVAKMLLEVIQK